MRRVVAEDTQDGQLSPDHQPDSDAISLAPLLPLPPSGRLLWREDEGPTEPMFFPCDVPATDDAASETWNEQTKRAKALGLGTEAVTTKLAVARSSTQPIERGTAIDGATRLSPTRPRVHVLVAVLAVVVAVALALGQAAEPNAAWLLTGEASSRTDR